MNKTQAVSVAQLVFNSFTPSFELRKIDLRPNFRGEMSETIQIDLSLQLNSRFIISEKNEVL